MPIVPGTNPALQTWNGQFFVVADGSAQNRISLPFLQVNSGGATYVVGADNNGVLSYYNPAFGGSATNLIGGNTGYIPYQANISTTTFLPIGTTGQVLKVSNLGIPAWSEPTAQNIIGGAAGEVVYQTATDVTGFTAVGTTGQVLTSRGAGSPTWTNTAIAKAYASISSTAIVSNSYGGVTASVASGTFTVTSSAITATSIILVTQQAPATGGYAPVVVPTTGSCTVKMFAGTALTAEPFSILIF